MQTTKTTKEKLVDNQKDIEDISSVIQIYVEGGRKGNAAIMKRAFRENATIHGHTDGGLLAGLEYQAEIPLMTFIRHTVFGLTLGVLVSKWFKSSSDKSNEKL